MRRRILVLVVAMTTLVVLAFAIPLAIVIRDRVYTEAVKKLESEAHAIALYLRFEDTTPDSEEISAELTSLDVDDTQASVELSDGTILGEHPSSGFGSAPQLPEQDFGHGGPRPGNGGGPGPEVATTKSWNGGKIAQQSVPVGPNGHYIVRVYASDDQLHSGETRWWWLLLATSAGLLIIGAAAAELLTRRIVRPLVRTADTAQQLATGVVAARAPTQGPREIAAVGVALNALADRIDELISDERETVADLSHRLRTPLTALRLDAEALHDSADADRIGGHVVELERTLTAVIHAARRPQREGRMPSCDATVVIGERVEFWTPLAEDQRRPASIALPSSPLPVRAAAEDLAAAVDALIENVIAHTPEGTAFSVSLRPDDADGAVLVVTDDGPGLPDDASIRGRSDRGSTGLGLDIARRCAESSGGSITLGASASGGALVTLRLGHP